LKLDAPEGEVLLVRIFRVGLVEKVFDPINVDKKY
jgi:hypothetical protein